MRCRSALDRRVRRYRTSPVHQSRRRRHQAACVAALRLVPDINAVALLFHAEVTHHGHTVCYVLDDAHLRLQGGHAFMQQFADAQSGVERSEGVLKIELDLPPRRYSAKP